MNALAKLLVALVAVTDTDEPLPYSTLDFGRSSPFPPLPRKNPTMATKKPHLVVYPKTITSFRNLEGGQFGTLDVSALSPRAIEMAFGSDFVRLTIEEWARLRHDVDHFFFRAHGQPVPPQYSAQPIHENVGDEEVTIDPVPPQEEAPPVKRPRRAAGSRGR